MAARPIPATHVKLKHHTEGRKRLRSRGTSRSKTGLGGIEMRRTLAFRQIGQSKSVFPFIHWFQQSGCTKNLQPHVRSSLLLTRGSPFSLLESKQTKHSSRPVNSVSEFVESEGFILPFFSCRKFKWHLLLHTETVCLAGKSKTYLLVLDTVETRK